ncbi:MAG: hypothetical protein K9J37_14450 [Saprospiraceae bacterium]|nr:hypothetical protein [Saprospiraceae bacterium]MCF8251108.1 hypothetical protein [Saprospiraceae bacterium]MCF8281010.1 hypothetical protein [Bacteroidales bacterium]MCF8312934.1 hypothetical protein [Saprospiraceae bacterium]MCF8441367.1 hypothetical protein [Saprospiraceae bacterium]
MKISGSCFFIFLFCLQILSAQAPFKFNYQAAVRDGVGIAANKTMNVRVNILDANPTGAVLYQEIHGGKSTNEFGLLNLEIGGGLPVTGSMSGIAWAAGARYLKIEVDADNTGNFQNIGLPVQLVSVPYALYAETSGNGGGENYAAGNGISISNNVISNTGDSDNNPANELQSLAVNGNQMSISNGNTVTLPSGTAYLPGNGINISGNTISAIDPSPTNELQSLAFEGTQLSISNGNSVTIPGGTTYNAGTGIQITGNTIINTGDNDSNPTNEIQSLSISGSQLALSNGGGSVTLPAGTTYTAGQGIAINSNAITNTGDNDNNPTNEIQSLSISGNQLALSNGGGSVTLPTGTTYTAGSGIAINGNTISANDASASNEIQSLSMSGNTLNLSNGGGSVTLPSGTTYTAGNGINISGSTISSSTWQKSGTDVYYAAGKVGIGTPDPTSALTVDYTIKGIDGFEELYRFGKTASGGGILETLGSGSRNFAATNLAGNEDLGYAAVGDVLGDNKAGMYVNASGIGVLFANGPNGGIKNFRMPHPAQPGKLICYASLEGPEAAAYCRGTGTLINGQGTVFFTEDFTIVANETTMTVMLTPLSGDSKGLAVIEKTAVGFKVKELLSGTGSYQFDWEVKAVRSGHENYQVIQDKRDSMPAEEKK